MDDEDIDRLIRIIDNALLAKYESPWKDRILSGNELSEYALDHYTVDKVAPLAGTLQFVKQQLEMAKNRKKFYQFWK